MSHYHTSPESCNMIHGLCLLCEEKHHSPLAGIESRILGRPAASLSAPRPDKECTCTSVAPGATERIPDV
jgi:hypothetical protein